jgi:hypothetical protein
MLSIQKCQVLPYLLVHHYSLCAADYSQCRYYYGSAGHSQEDIYHNDSFHKIFIINSHTGRILVSTDEKDEGENRLKAPYFTEALRTMDLFIKDIYYSATENMPGMAFSIPVFGLGDQDNIIGILVAIMTLNLVIMAIFNFRFNSTPIDLTEIIVWHFFCFIVVVALNELRRRWNAPLNLNGIDKKDEIGRLSGAFDQMTDNLKTITASRDNE